MSAAARAPSEADVVIVGAGPAGSATALLLARAGADVLLLDRDAFPRAKPCGECLSPQATRLLADLGVLAAVEAAGPARLLGWRMVAPGGASFEARFRDVTTDPLLGGALAVGRERLDAILLAAAIRAGARFVPGVRVLDLAPGPPGVLGIGPSGRFAATARLVVGADGLRSVVARRIGAPARRPRLRKLSLTAHATDIEPSADGLGEMHLADGLCAGIAPIDEDGRTHNVTLVADAGRFGREVAGEPVAFFRRSLERFPRLRDRVRQARLLPALRPGRTGPLLASGPFDRPTRRIVTPGHALVGDAAGYYDPFTGQGICQALAGASLLAAEAARALERDRDPVLLVAYEENQRKLVRGTRWLQHIIEAVISRPRLADLAIGRIARRPEVGRALLAATGDLAPPFEALSPGLLLRFLAPGSREVHPT